MMLDHFNMPQEATLVRDAVKWTLENGFVSKDIEPVNFYFTSTIGDLISDYIRSIDHNSINIENIHLRKSTII
jgi:3-isopropylmalate dehydrogenase